MSNPEGTIDLGWLLRDESVSDSALAEALVCAYFPELQNLAAALVSLQGRSAGSLWEASQAIALDALAQVVVQRDRLWRHPSLRAWLVRLILHRSGHRSGRWRRLWKKPHTTMEGLDPVYGSGASRHEDGETASKQSTWLQNALQRMGPQEWQVMFLHEILGLSEDEIAWALDILPEPVAYFMKKVRYRLLNASRAAGKTPTAAQLPNNPIEKGASLSNAIQEYYPIAPLSEEMQRSLIGAVRALVQARRERRRAAIFFQEAALVSLVLGVLFFSCRAAGLLPEEIIHRYKTPTPYAKNANPMTRPTPEAAFYYNYYTKRGDTMEEIARRAGVRQADIIAMNPFNHWPGRGFMLDLGAALRIPAGPAMDWRIMPTPVAPVAPPPPLTARSDVSTILERIQTHSQHWHTLWMNVQEDTYGPPGYLGPPLQQALWQAWNGPPGWAKGIVKWVNDPYERPYSIYFYLDGVYISVNEENGDLQGLFPESEDGPLPMIMPLQDSLDPQIRWEVLREDTVAGRPAIVLSAYSPDGSNPFHLWVDAVTGVILRRTTYSAQAPGVVLHEMLVTDIAYDQDFPAVVFSPTESRFHGFAADFRGLSLPDGQVFPTQAPDPANGHARLPTRPLPPGFEPSRQPVYLQWPEGWYFDTRVPRAGDTSITFRPAVSVFASRYHLGDLPLENVQFHACRRSSDGRLIALSVGSGLAGYTSSRLYWFALENPQDLRPVAELGYWNNIYAFSPDSRRLAFFGCDNMGACSLRALDLATGDLAEIDTRGHFPYALAWSPYGRFLALVVEASTETSQFALEVVDVDSGQEIYFSPYDPQTGDVPPGAPLLPWDLSIPRLDNTDTGCMVP